MALADSSIFGRSLSEIESLMGTPRRAWPGEGARVAATGVDWSTIVAGRVERSAEDGQLLLGDGVPKHFCALEFVDEFPCGR